VYLAGHDGGHVDEVIGAADEAVGVVEPVERAMWHIAVVVLQMATLPPPMRASSRRRWRAGG